MGGIGSQSSRSDIYFKLKFAVLLSPILASAAFRHLPWDSVDYRLHIYCWDLDNIIGGRGPRKPKYMSQYLPKIDASSSFYSNFSVRQLPSDAAGFRELPSPHISLGFRQHVMWAGSPVAKVPDPIFT